MNNDVRYTHTTIEWCEPRIWAHKRDCKDRLDNRDVEPLDDAISHAIGRLYAQSEELVKVEVHVEVIDVQPIEVEVTV